MRCELEYTFFSQNVRGFGSLEKEEEVISFMRRNRVFFKRHGDRELKKRVSMALQSYSTDYPVQSNANRDVSRVAWQLF